MKWIKCLGDKVWCNKCHMGKCVIKCDVFNYTINCIRYPVIKSLVIKCMLKCIKCSAMKCHSECCRSKCVMNFCVAKHMNV